MTVYLHDHIKERLILPSCLQTVEYEAAVLVPLINIKNEWHVLLTQRTSTLRHHGGEVAFPGGKRDSVDNGVVDTALRETEEEIGLSMHRVIVIGALDEMETRSLSRVRPIVGVFDETTPLKANESEVQAIFTVPLSFFIHDKRVRTDVFSRQVDDKVLQQWVPAYQYQGYEIWGFTAGVIVQLLNRCFDAGIQRKSLNGGSEKLW